MTEKKKFNLLKYVYGQTFAGQLGSSDGSGVLKVETKRVHSWGGILNWLQKKNHIYSGYTISNIDAENSILTYRFNRNAEQMYPLYLKAIERSMKTNSLATEPTGDIVGEQKKKDAFEEQADKKPVEYVDRDDRTTPQLNRDIQEELSKEAA